MKIILRAETKPFEQRTPLTPEGAQSLIKNGVTVQVESSPSRIFGDNEYAEAGCEIIPTGSWSKANTDVYILGLKELDSRPDTLRHRHIYFAHVFKGQEGWRDTLNRFKLGGGTLYDLEYLTDDSGQRVAAFGYWAGYAGCGVAIEQWCRQQTHPGQPLAPLKGYPNSQEFVQKLKGLLTQVSRQPRVMVMGALGRCGQGAVDIAQALGLEIVGWDLEETAGGGPFEEILRHDIFVNGVLVTQEIPPFITHEMLRSERQLSVISDVSCDPTSPVNPLPIYDRVTTMDRPALSLYQKPPLDLIAIDHLPSLLPRESSIDFGAQLLPHLVNLPQGSPVWQRAADLFCTTIRGI